MNDGFEIKEYMTPMPYKITRDEFVQDALSRMRKEQIRHLPVEEKDGTLVGLVTDRDVKLALSFNGSERMKVEDVMLPHPYIVYPTARLSDVCSRMAEQHIGCAIVAENGKVVGIFTANDALKVLGERVRDELARAA